MGPWGADTDMRIADIGTGAGRYGVEVVGLYGMQLSRTGVGAVGCALCSCAHRTVSRLVEAELCRAETEL